MDNLIKKKKSKKWVSKDSFNWSNSPNQKMEKRWPGKHTLLAANFSMDDSLMRKEVGNLSKTYKVKGSQ